MLVFTVLTSAQTLRFANAFSDNAVLQQKSNVRIWGWDVPARDITVECSWLKETLTATTDFHGRWVVTAATPEGSFDSHTITAQSALQSVTIENVVFGDVWFCAGQSNMEMQMANDARWNLYVEGSEEEIARSANKNLRYIKVNRDETFSKKEDTATTGWVEFTPSSVQWVSAVGYYFAKNIFKELNYPIGLFINAYGGSSIEGWIPRDGVDPSDYQPELERLNNEFASGSERPYYQTMSCLYNSMTYPFTNYEIKGWLWYQGETNVGDEIRYKTMMQDLVSSWRKAWGDEKLPFYYVQLAPFYYESYKNGLWSTFAVAQQQIAKTINHCEMVVIADLGVPSNVHPKYKRQVGERLANVALANTYNFTDVQWKVAEPYYVSVDNKNHKVTIEFENVYEGLSFDDEIIEFEISYDGEIFEKVSSQKAIGDKVILTYSKKRVPQCVRYCWYDESSSNLFNSAGLSVGPMTLDINKFSSY